MKSHNSENLDIKKKKKNKETIEIDSIIGKEVVAQGTKTVVDNPYRVNKLAYHSKIIEKLKKGESDSLVLVHFMPSNMCNQFCNFCSYRMPYNKNASCFDTSKVLSN